MELKSFTIHVDGMQIHYLDTGERTKRPLLLLHSISGNARIFNGLMTSGIADDFRLIIPDLPGRGKSSRAKHGLSLDENCKVLNEILDHADLAGATVCGHSFGGLLAIYFAAHFPGRTTKLILLDSDIKLNPLLPFLLIYPFGRLFVIHPSMEECINAVKAAPFIDEWNDDMIPFIEEDVQRSGGTMLAPKVQWIDILIAASDIYSISQREWQSYLASIECNVLIIQASRPFVHGQSIVMDDSIRKTMCILRKAEHVKVDGNHLTMLFGKGANQIKEDVTNFVLRKRVPVYN